MNKNSTSYHHGDLPAKLLEAATETIAEEGIERLTMRGLSERVGVSRTAAYRHYANKSELLAAVAAEGFRELANQLNLVMMGVHADEDPLMRFRNMGRAYLGFAHQNPTIYRLMFSEALLRADDNVWESNLGLVNAGNEAIGKLVDMVSECQKTEAIKPGDPQEIAIAAWASMHGLATLYIDGRLERFNTIDTLTEQTMDALINGLKR